MQYKLCVQIRSFTGPYFPVFGLKQEDTDLEKIRIWTPFTQCRIWERFSSMLESNLFVAMFYQYVYIKFYVSFDQLQLR